MRASFFKTGLFVFCILTPCSGASDKRPLLWETDADQQATLEFLRTESRVQKGELSTLEERIKFYQYALYVTLPTVGYLALRSVSCFSFSSGLKFLLKTPA